ncbi:MAG: bifunctional ornithine acetyltransferase/N-acetylglutamate synthase, partial [Chloroflexi bacterium]|nr:bifunctional ornithine acetyltransferase/N-acetylglutamate synthase [Chloroflexota bacterium]
NWGRAIAALGRSDAAIEEGRISLYLNDICVMDGGAPVPFFKDAAIAAMDRPEVRVLIRLGLGEGTATAWGCDLTEEYVRINSAYTT